MKHLLSNQMTVLCGNELTKYSVQASTRKVAEASISGGTKPKIDIQETVTLRTDFDDGNITVVLTREDLEEMLIMLAKEPYTKIMSRAFHKLQSGDRNEAFDVAISKKNNRNKINIP